MRLFFALWPPADLAGRLAETATQCVQGLGGRAARVETIHLTLAFLGEQPEAQLPAIVEAAHRVVMPPLELVVDQLGAWRHNRLLWAGCRSVPASLPALNAALGMALASAGVCLEDAGHPFFPHLTLVRALPSRSLSQALPDVAPLLWHCQHFVLVESLRRGDCGVLYRRVAEFPLAS